MTTSSGMRTGKPRIWKSFSSRMLRSPPWARGRRGGRGGARARLAGGLGVVGGRLVRIAVERAAFDRGDPLVEKLHQRAQQPGLGLAAQPEQDEVVARQHRDFI